MRRGLPASAWSFILALPTWWIVIRDKPTNEVRSFDHLFAEVALLMLPFAAGLGLFGVGFAALGSGQGVRKRLAAFGLSLPALVAAGIVLYIVATIPPT